MLALSQIRQPGATAFVAAAFRRASLALLFLFYAIIPSEAAFRHGRGRPGPGQGSRVDGESSPGDQTVEPGEEATKWPEKRGTCCRLLSSFLAP
jgi:hypothetical protein